MIRKLFWVFIIAGSTLFFSACSSDNVEAKRDSIFPLKKGNYWIYRTKITLADGQTGFSQYLDSVFIQGDTIMNNRKYWIQIGTFSSTQYLRDSADCVIKRLQAAEQIIYTTNRNIPPESEHRRKVIANIDEITEVPAGSFKTIDCQTLIKKDPSGQGHGHDFPSFDENFSISEHFICSPEVGMVKDIYYYLGSTIEIQLVRYKLN